MSRKHPIARYHLPLDVNPPTTVCFQVQVPNDFFHIIAFKSQIYQLASAAQWDNDDSHTALDVAAVWWDVFNKLKLCEPPTLVGGIEGGDDLLIRQNPTNPCLLETSINGTDWCVFADLSKCVPAGSQPGSGSGLPPAGGGSQCYDARMQASSKWLLPYQVNTGDVITISLSGGAASDGSGSWFCPNGQTFFLNACTGPTSTSGSDPAPSIPHMRLIAKIGSVYYDAYNVSITVPAGISHANVEFQVNDPSLSDNYGELTFKACVQNNGAAVWTHTFDFTVSDGGFTSDATNGGGAYIPGTGWKSNNASLNDFSIHRTGLPSYTATQAEYTVVIDTPSSGHVYTDDVPGAHTLPTLNFPGNGTHVIITTGSLASTNGVFRIGMDGTNDSGGHHQIIQKLIMTGTGVDPF